MNVRLKNWNNSHNKDESVISLINAAENLKSKFGRWPSFDGSEILSLTLVRGNILECIRKNDWSNKIGVSMEVEFYIFDERFSDDDPNHNPASVKLTFKDVSELQIDEFNYQNAICGLGIRREKSLRLDAEVFRVSWGGAAIRHDVCFICEGISVGEVFKIINK